MGKWAINGIIAVVTTVWAITIIASIVKPNYNPPPTVHLAMMAIVGALFGRQVLGKAYDDNSKGEGKK